MSLQDCGADCVKLQKSELKEKYTCAVLKRLYDSKHSWGKTYGEHKQFLEFSHAEYIELKWYADSLEMPFTASGMDQVK